MSGDDVRTGMPVVVRDLMGREVLRTRYHGVLTSRVGLRAATWWNYPNCNGGCAVKH
ncbi:MAG: hypothetical protein R2810_04990 [Flavobacteriales bacterium]